MTAIKESSDELNPAVAVSATEIPAPKRRNAADYLALAMATCGVGYFPIAPGTLGSLVGVAIYLPLEHATRQLLANIPAFVLPLDTPVLAIKSLVILGLTLIGIWAASRVEARLRIKDPAIVVIDEVAGQMIALLSVPAFFPGWLPVLSAFLLFRAFDIWKPYPIRRLEALESGLGIMADDVVAGAYAFIVNCLLISLYVLLMK
ncbi:MAG TPA: phosphatidylglycerophosphatase A [Pyrinomonadaceae bacterium]|jgi:phosphatidylglycerophosphatase A